MVRLRGLNKSDQKVIYTGKDVSYLSPQERQEREQRIKSAENYLQNYKFSSFRTERERDITPILRQLKEDKKILSELSAPTVSNQEKNALLKQCRKLEKNIKIGMPTFDEMMGKRKTNPDKSKYQEAIPSIVDKNIKWTLAKNPLVREWKRIKRILEPDDPNATNVENLRKKK